MGIYRLAASAIVALMMLSISTETADAGGFLKKLRAKRAAKNCVTQGTRCNEQCQTPMAEVNPPNNLAWDTCFQETGNPSDLQRTLKQRD